MKRSKFTDEQIAFALRQAHANTLGVGLARRSGGDRTRRAVDQGLLSLAAGTMLGNGFRSGRRPGQNFLKGRCGSTLFLRRSITSRCSQLWPCGFKNHEENGSPDLRP